MDHLRKLMFVVFCAGATAGAVLFVLQHFTIVPLIEAAERYEPAEHGHDQSEWKPSEGFERTAFTLLTTLLTAVGYAALLFGFLNFMGRNVDARTGALWGLAAFVCFQLAPSLGLPPQPPGVPVADVQHRQLWWIGTVVATATGLWLLAQRTWSRRIYGVICIALPHLIGAPTAIGSNPVPIELMRRFAITSVITTAIFWVLVGSVGGFLYSPPRVTEPRP